LTRVNIRIKVVIIVVLKPDSRVDPEQIPDHESRELIWVDTSQYMDKNNYYHSFKTQLKSQPRVILELQVGSVNPGLPKIFYKNRTKATSF